MIKTNSYHFYYNKNSEEIRHERKISHGTIISILKYMGAHKILECSQQEFFILSFISSKHYYYS